MPPSPDLHVTHCCHTPIQEQAVRPTAWPTLNTVIVAGEKLIVKDCGQENTIKGVKLVDSSIDPCF